MHSPNFTNNLETTNPLNIFNQNKTSFGGSFGIIGNYPINETFVISGRLGYNMLNGKLDGKNFFDNPTTLDATIGYLEFTPAVQFHNLLPVKPLYFIGGIELGIPIVKKFAVAAEQDIPDANLRLAIALGAGYVFKLSNDWYLSPEATFRLPFNKVSSNTNFDTWDVPQLRVGFSLTFNLSPSKNKDKSSESEGLSAGFKEIRYIDKDNNIFPLQKIRVEDVQYTELFPLIPYIFCDENIAAPSDRAQILTTKVETGEFTIKSLEPSAMQINMQTLNIVGTRMNQYPNATITITGTEDNKGESKTKGLSLKRADFVKNYLNENFGIAPDRMTVRATTLPAKPSSSKVQDGIEENRRIEITSSDPNILQPILIAGDNQRLAEPDVIEFIPFIKPIDENTKWQLEIMQAGKTFRKKEGKGAPPPFRWIIIPNELENKQIPIDYVFTVNAGNGATKIITGSIPVDYFSFSRKQREEQQDKTVSKFSLILFDFDNAEVSEADMSIVDKYIIPEIKYNSIVRIYGYTDRIGDEKYNQKLAERRANTVKALLEPKAKTARYEVHGVGENEVIYDNDTPIGRHLSRTVQVIIITPKQ